MMHQGVMTMKLTARLFLETKDGVKEFKDCTKEELETFNENALKRVSETLSLYYTQHPEELKAIKNI